MSLPKGTHSFIHLFKAYQGHSVSVSKLSPHPRYAATGNIHVPTASAQVILVPTHKGISQRRGDNASSYQRYSKHIRTPARYILLKYSLLVRGRLIISHRNLKSLEMSWGLSKTLLRVLYPPLLHQRLHHARHRLHPPHRRVKRLLHHQSIASATSSLLQSWSIRESLPSQPKPPLPMNFLKMLSSTSRTASISLLRCLLSWSL